MQQDEPYLQFAGISKSFPGVQALTDVSFGVGDGRVHALIGENGAGKSTLLKTLSGAYTPTAGTVRLGGADRVFHSAAKALAAGVAVIYQELHLAPEMTVAENLYLGHLPSRFGVVDKRRLRSNALRQLALLGEDLDPNAKVGRLPLAQRQMVEIAKALTRGAKVIAFDEPTSSLSSREVQKLFAVIRDLKARGHVILYVSHRLEELFQICDEVTVLRDGMRVETVDSLEGVTRDVLVNRMVGRDLRNVYNYAPRPHGAPALDVVGLAGPGVAEPATLTVAQGEILGLFGLVGAGRTELLRLIFGAVPMTAGAVKVWGRPVHLRAPPRRHPGRGHALPGRPEEGRGHPDSVGAGEPQLERPPNAFAPRVLHQRAVGAEQRQRPSRQTRHQDSLAPAVGPASVRRQPAEGDSGAVAVGSAQGAPVRRADSRHRRRRQERALLDHLHPCQPGPRGDRGLQRPA